MLVLISHKPYLLSHMEEKLKEKSLIRLLGQLEKIKPKKNEVRGGRFDGYVTLKYPKR